MQRLDDIENALSAMDVDLTAEAIDTLSDHGMQVALPVWRAITPQLLTGLNKALPDYCKDVRADHDNHVIEIPFQQ